MQDVHFQQSHLVDDLFNGFLAKEVACFINHQRPPREPRVVRYAERSFRNIPPDGGFIRRPVVEDEGHHLDQALPRVKDAPGIGCGKDDSVWG